MPAIHRLLPALAIGASVLALTTPAHGFDPNAGTEPITAAPTYQPAARYLPSNIVPTRYYVPSNAPIVNAAPVPQPTVIAPLPTPIAAPAPVYAEPSSAVATIAPLPEIREVPAEQPALITPVAGYVQPAANYPVAVAPHSGYKANRFSLGIEGYYDDYREDVVNLTDQGFFGSVTGSYDHYFNPNWYGTAELRGSRGTVDYESISGTVDDISQWEAEGRLLVGYDQPYPSGDRIKVYTGAGARYFNDEFKGFNASLGGAGYDRRITQFYVPLGVTYEFQAYGLQFAPNFEYNQLLIGFVQSRLQNIPGFQELNNEQTTGYGLRGEFMVGKIDASGRGWQAGPFIRYWDIADSDVAATPSFTGLEPQNTRLQVGAKLKWLF